jgi:hypothetical protein
MDIPARLQLKVGEHWTARLPGLGSAGYQWSCELEGSAGVVAVALTPIPTPRLPAGGEPPDNFSLDTSVEVRALNLGAVVLHLIQRRPWERDRPPLNRHVIEVTVVAQSPPLSHRHPYEEGEAAP